MCGDADCASRAQRVEPGARLAFTAAGVGDVVYALPWHVCPTVALHEEVFVVDGGVAKERWSVTARRRRLEI